MNHAFRLMHGRRVAVHAHGAAGIKVAIRAGVDTVEHADVRVMEKVSFVMKGGEIYKR